MPNDTLAEDAEGALRGAADFLRLGHNDDRARAFHLGTLQTLESRLAGDIQERSTTYLAELSSAEAKEIDAKWQELNSDPRFARANTQQKAHQQTFDHLSVCPETY
jgi:hypothetical protein